ncbi:hypothetical protein EDC01DRAFT_626567 [Geopyxis carbonaria]|nr:hypothetical protein EDC01DRAFT_626567 [Geopyxis carbonaria]
MPKNKSEEFRMLSVKTNINTDNSGVKDEYHEVDNDGAGKVPATPMTSLLVETAQSTLTAMTDGFRPILPNLNPRNRPSPSPPTHPSKKRRMPRRRKTPKTPKIPKQTPPSRSQNTPALGDVAVPPTRHDDAGVPGASTMFSERKETLANTVRSSIPTFSAAYIDQTGTNIPRSCLKTGLPPPPGLVDFPAVPGSVLTEFFHVSCKLDDDDGKPIWPNYMTVVTASKPGLTQSELMLEYQTFLALQPPDLMSFVLSGHYTRDMNGKLQDVRSWLMLVLGSLEETQLGCMCEPAKEMLIARLRMHLQLLGTEGPATDMAGTWVVRNVDTFTYHRVDKVGF